MGNRLENISEFADNIKIGISNERISKPENIASRRSILIRMRPTL